MAYYKQTKDIRYKINHGVLRAQNQSSITVSASSLDRDGLTFSGKISLP